jgi:hypothetical protein
MLPWGLFALSILNAYAGNHLVALFLALAGMLVPLLAEAAEVLEDALPEEE